MSKQPDIDKRIEKILDSLEGIKRAEPQPFFYTRLIGRLQRNEKSSWETMGSFLAKPVVVIVSLCFILVFNAFLLFRTTSEKTTTPTVATEQGLITDNESILASSSSFDYENFDQQ